MLTIGAEVSAAQKAHRPVVALESTIISHGMPYPENVENALKVEECIRACGAVPATIGIREGEVLIGLKRDHLEFFGRNRSVQKASRRDIAHVIATKKSAATTVAATMIFADRANIALFATGGIGGVHRNGAQTLDISADLHEFTTSNVAVVCAGAKSILDIGLTLERLETWGVPVIGYQTDEFPAFYSRESGHKVPIVCDSIEEIARMIAVARRAGMGGGMVIANPIPEEDALPYAEMEQVIEQAERERMAQGIHGKEVTPFLLKRIVALTNGRSLIANRALILHNARVAAQIAIALQDA